MSRFTVPELKMWEKGCEHDEVRNEFVLPVLRSIIRTVQARTMVDLGAGSGYIIEKLAELDRGSTDYVAVDNCNAALDFLRLRFLVVDHVRVLDADLGRPLRWPNLYAPSIAASVFTMLELSDTALSSMMANLVTFDHIAFFLPDPLDDVSNETARASLSAGKTVAFHKQDKFTGADYPYHARRFESWGGLVFKRSFNLVSIHTFTTRGRQHHFAYEFHAR